MFGRCKGGNHYLTENANCSTFQACTLFVSGVKSLGRKKKSLLGSLAQLKLVLLIFSLGDGGILIIIKIKYLFINDTTLLLATGSNTSIPKGLITR